jgi:hypothetical protein
MVKRVLIGAASAAAFAALSVPAGAQQSNWRTIAYKTVSGGTDVDRITVRGGARYREVRLCAYNAPLRMRDFDIRFENNQRQDVRVRERIRAGTCTRNIDLSGGRRDIESIRLKYEPIARNYARPLVRVQVRG